MLLKSEVTSMEYEIKTYTTEDGSRGICHESLQDILENQLGDGVSYEIEVLAATETYCAAKCTITDGDSRKIQYFNDVNTNALEGREESQQRFAKAHPLIAAVQSAVDGAVKTYLKWPRVLPADSYAGTSVITDKPDNIPEGMLDALVAEAEQMKEENEKPAEDTRSIDIGMNPPEESKEPDEKADEDANDKENKEARLAELGQKKAPARSKYSNMTYDEIWESNSNWFSYIKNNNRSTTYEDAREYAILREAKEKGQL